MELLNILTGGIAGTWLMTLFMGLASLVTGYNFHVPTILGTMITGKTKPSGAASLSPASIITGYGAHYLVGILFSFIYYTALKAGHWPDNIPNTLLFGLLAAISAVIFWFTLLRLHPLAPAVNRKLYLPLIFTAHFLFALGMHFGVLAVLHLFIK